ncbi:MAG: hypothetical protein KF878_01005 [Planctomycetes bacterium]|nr:hypothetical protein [Planctomycetota bacterium]MCW8138269.1 hypothetical protein [Planctomycetota bacterium]
MHYLPHPSSRDPNVLCDTWRAAITQLRELVTPDADGDPSGPNYRTEWREEDYARFPRRDLPKDAPSYVGDDSWGRAARPRHNCVERARPDDRRTLLLETPEGQRFSYHVPEATGHSNATPTFAITPLD